MKEKSAKTPATGLTRLRLATINSINGLTKAWKSEQAVRQEIFLIAGGIPLALYLTSNNVERAVLIISLVMVLVVELLNTAIETAIDRIGLEHHPLSGLAKDVSSAAVLITVILLITVWSLILL